MRKSLFMFPFIKSLMFSNIIFFKFAGSFIRISLLQFRSWIWLRYSYLIFKDFHISVSWWFFIWVWVTASPPQVSRTRLRILAVLSNAVFWIISTCSPTSMSSRPFNNPLFIVPKAPITIGIIVTFHVPQLFQFSSKVEVLILLCTFLQIYSVVRRNSKVDNFANSLLFVDNYKFWSPGRDKVIRLYVKVT